MKALYTLSFRGFLFIFLSDTERFPILRMGFVMFCARRAISVALALFPLTRTVFFLHFYTAFLFSTLFLLNRKSAKNIPIKQAHRAGTINIHYFFHKIKLILQKIKRLFTDTENEHGIRYANLLVRIHTFFRNTKHINIIILKRGAYTRSPLFAFKHTYFTISTPFGTETSVFIFPSLISCRTSTTPYGVGIFPSAKLRLPKCGSILILRYPGSAA